MTLKNETERVTWKMRRKEEVKPKKEERKMYRENE